MKKRIVIVGGVAGGASAAARARRLSEESEIIVIERGPFVSFANCGLPYFVGGEIIEQGKLSVQTPQSLRARFGLDVRVRHEVIEIVPSKQEVLVKDLENGTTYAEPYDELVLATGSSPLRPPIPLIDTDTPSLTECDSGSSGDLSLGTHAETQDAGIDFK